MQCNSYKNSGYSRFFYRFSILLLHKVHYLFIINKILLKVGRESYQYENSASIFRLISRVKKRYFLLLEKLLWINKLYNWKIECYGHVIFRRVACLLNSSYHWAIFYIFTGNNHPNLSQYIKARFLYFRHLQNIIPCNASKSPCIQYHKQLLPKWRMDGVKHC